MSNRTIVGDRIAGIEYVRALMSVFVVIWHMRGAGESLIFSKRYAEHVFTFSDLVNFHLLLLAVPTFIFFSIFLYTRKGASYLSLKKRLIKITTLLTFWSTALIVFKGGFQGLINVVPGSTGAFIITVLRAGGTIFYFFVCLIICLLTAYFFANLKIHFQVFLFVLSAVVLTCLPGIAKITGIYLLCAYWSPVNFIPSSLLAVLVSQNLDYFYSRKTTLLLVSFVLCVLFAVFEWRYSVGGVFFNNQGYAIPAYTRTSLLFGTFIIAIMALTPGIKANGLIKYMAEYSLALYCIHPFLLGPTKKIMSLFFQTETLSVYFSIVFVILFSYAMAMALKKYYLKDELVV